MADEIVTMMEQTSIGAVYVSELHGDDATGDGSEARPYKTALRACRECKAEPLPPIMVDAKEKDKPNCTSPDVMQEELLARLDGHLSDRSYIGGSSPSTLDHTIYSLINKSLQSIPVDLSVVFSTHFHLSRWYRHVHSLVCDPQVTFSLVEDGTLLEQFSIPSMANHQKYEPIAKSQLKKVTKLWKDDLKKQEVRRRKEEEAAKQRAAVVEEAAKVTISEDSSLPPATLVKIKDGEAHRGERIKVKGWVHRLRRQGKNMMFIVLRDGTGFLQCVLLDRLCQTLEAVSLTTESTVCLYGSLLQVPEGKQVLYLRSLLYNAFVSHYKDRGYVQMTPPTLVQTQCEGGSTLFDFSFFGEKAFLTQSSQLYLETCLPSFGDVYCIEQSYRAEQSRTRRHLAAYTHVEAECPFITFEELLDRIEDLVCDVTQRVLSDPRGQQVVQELHPDFQMPTRPFFRMPYADAIKYLQEHDIRKEDGSLYAFGEMTPPTLVQTQCEGGSTLFDFSFFGEKAFLTQSSQLYLETCLPRYLP
ncbi:Aminoacyl-tRNA synthetase class II (D/K/N) [Trinorchestia longiramus]|nr:Aminoacyl-tRNA synthetase class II (D/K/N) [Trinorchestia longiramus]